MRKEIRVAKSSNAAEVFDTAILWACGAAKLIEEEVGMCLGEIALRGFTGGRPGLRIAQG